MSAPRVGTIVHYVSYGTTGGEYGSACRAAVITEVGTARLMSLAVLSPTGMFFSPKVPMSKEHLGGTWHYICAPRDEPHLGIVHWGGFPMVHEFTGLSSDVPSKVTCETCLEGLG